MQLVCALAVAMQSAGAGDALARGQKLWDQRLANSAIAALETAVKDPRTAAEAHEWLGRIYTFKGWQQESVFPGWHDEPDVRARAIAELKASVAADPSRASAQEALRVAEGFTASADAVPPAEPRPEVQALSRQLTALGANAATPVDAILKAIDARLAAQADPAPYFAGAEILLNRGEFDRAIALAERGRAASDRFIDENLSAYQMSGKAAGSYARGRATAADLTGWALFQKHDLPGAIAKLEEAERLNQGLDFTNQFRLGEVERARGGLNAARDHYINALSLSGGAPPLRQKATEALAAIYAARPAGSADNVPFDTWLAGVLERRREDRRAEALKSFVNRPLPALPLTTLDGQPFDVQSLKGKIVLLDFFASWCGLCKAELPHVKAAFSKYQSDPDVTFVLVSIDQDMNRLKRYLNDMKFPFRVARLAIDSAEAQMGFDNVPAAYYIDRGGVVRYQTNGTESHGDSPSRVGWFIEQLRAQR